MFLSLVGGGVCAPLHSTRTAPRFAQPSGCPCENVFRLSSNLSSVEELQPALFAHPLQRVRRRYDSIADLEPKVGEADRWKIDKLKPICWRSTS
jgi:hypothetical protein